MSEEQISKEDQRQLQYLDNREYQSKFLLSPDIDGEEDYSHLDKNIAITNLKHNPKINLDEVTEMRAILRGLHILNNSKHYKTEEKDILIGYKDIQEGEKIIRKPVFEKRKVKISKFPKTYHSLKSEVLAFSVATGSRNGHRMKAAITNRLEKTADIKDLTTPEKRWGFGKKY